MEKRYGLAVFGNDGNIKHPSLPIYCLVDFCFLGESDAQSSLPLQHTNKISLNMDILVVVMRELGVMTKPLFRNPLSQSP